MTPSYADEFRPQRQILSLAIWDAVGMLALVATDVAIGSSSALSFGIALLVLSIGAHLWREDPRVVRAMTLARVFAGLCLLIDTASHLGAFLQSHGVIMNGFVFS